MTTVKVMLGAVAMGSAAMALPRSSGCRSHESDRLLSLIW